MPHENKSDKTYGRPEFLEACIDCILAEGKGSGIRRTTVQMRQLQAHMEKLDKLGKANLFRKQYGNLQAIFQQGMCDGVIGLYDERSHIIKLESEDKLVAAVKKHLISPEALETARKVYALMPIPQN